MMIWHGGGWGWVLMTVGMVVFWALVITAVVLLVRYLINSRGASGTPAVGGRSAEDLLAERYARGEIDDDEYQRRMTRLRQSRAAAPK